MLQELMADALAGHVVGALGVPGIVGLAAAGLVGWKLLKDAKKPVLLAILLAIGVVFAWPWLPFGKSGGGNGGSVSRRFPWLTSDPLTPNKPQAVSLQRLSRLRPHKPGEPPLPPRTPAEQLKPFIDRLEQVRIEKAIKEQGAWPPPPEWRRANLAQAFAKETERKQKVELLAKAEQERETKAERGFESIPPTPLPAMPHPLQGYALKLDQREQWLNQAQADLARMQPRYSPGGAVTDRSLVLTGIQGGWRR